MNKEKLKHWPFNAFWNLFPSLFLYLALNAFSDWDTMLIGIIIINFYTLAVSTGVQNDYVEEKLKQLEEQKANK